MPLVADLAVGEGVRIDATDTWVLKEVIHDGTAAVLFDPAGKEVTVQADVAFRAAPGLRLSITPADKPDRIRLVIDAFIPLIHRYPPRTGKPLTRTLKAPQP